MLGRRLSGFRAVGRPLSQAVVPAGDPLCWTLRRRGGDCRYFVDRICPGILKVGWNALPLHCCPRRFLRCRRMIPSGARRERVVRMSVGQSGGHRKSGQEDIGRASGECLGENEYDLQYRPAGAEKTAGPGRCALFVVPRADALHALPEAAGGSLQPARIVTNRHDACRRGGSAFVFVDLKTRRYDEGRSDYGFRERLRGDGRCRRHARATGN